MGNTFRRNDPATTDRHALARFTVVQGRHRRASDRREERRFDDAAINSRIVRDA